MEFKVKYLALNTNDELINKFCNFFKGPYIMEYK